MQGYAPFAETAQTWLQALAQYSEAQFSQKPHETAWSIGQVYGHLIGATQVFHLRHIETCLANPSEGASETKTEAGEATFAHHGFANMRIKGPEFAPQQSLAQAQAGLTALMTTMKEVETRILAAPSSGKTAHPRLGFLDAQEWYDLIEIHFRHHLHQKNRLDAWLTGAAYDG